MKIADGLLALRTLWVSYLTSFVVVLVVAFAVVPSLEPALPVAVALMGVLVVGSLGLATVVQIGRRPSTAPPTGDLTPMQVAVAFRARWLLQVAVASGVAVIGFVATVVSANVLPVVLGVIFGSVNLIRLAPSAANLARHQADLQEQGSTVELAPALQEASTWGRRPDRSRRDLDADGPA